MVSRLHFLKFFFAQNLKLVRLSSLRKYQIKTLTKAPRRRPVSCTKKRHFRILLGLSKLIFRSGCQALSLKVPDSNYNGTISVTVSGRTCQNWNSQTPHHHTITAPKKQYGNTNYCRNPNEGTNGVWCYTIDPSVRWEFCSQIQGFRKFMSFD